MGKNIQFIKPTTKPNGSNWPIGVPVFASDSFAEEQIKAGNAKELGGQKPASIIKEKDKPKEKEEN